MYGSATMIGKEKERSRFARHQQEDKVPKSRIRELCGVTKAVDQRIHEGVLRCFGHVERMENDRIA